MYKILNYSDTEWKNIIRQYNLDIYFASQYCKIWEDYGDGKAQAFLYESSLGKILYPYLVRKIGYLKSNINYFDISTPYGYGGPVLLEHKEKEIPLLVKEFRAEFNAYAHKRRIISEFIRFHPVYKNYNFFINSDIECKFVRNTIEIDLKNEPENILKSMKPKTRNEVRQAIKNGLNVQFYNKPTLENIQKFYEIYSATMNRLEASDYYKFSLEYFINTFNLLKENAEIAFVFYDNKIISSSIFLLSNKLVHYHLSGSLSEYKSYRPNNLMLYQAALRDKSMGKKCFHLGGGYSGNDSLFKFKKGFNKNGLLDFYVGTKINNKEIYNRLVREWKTKYNLGENFNSDFFPLYRCKL
jgi:hypothetical protein